MEPGLMILAPMGSGKSTWISTLSSLQKALFLDGDELLNRYNIPNKNYYWYPDGEIAVRVDKAAERQVISNLFNQFLQAGYNILYSGNPEIMPYDLLVMIDSDIRWRQVSSRKGFNPTRQQFDRENKAYTTEAAKNPSKVIHSFDILLK